MSTMREFLTAGQLGAVQLGLRPEQVTSLLGPPDDESVRRRPIHLLRYGSVELAFMRVPETTDSRLVSVAMYFDRSDRSVPPALRPTDWFPSGETNQADFRRHLGEAGIPVTANESGEEEYLTLSSGASVVFSQGKLHSIHFKRADRQPERKQMTVSLPEETLEKLRHRAREQGVSVNALIERMIKTGV